jgi:non-specific serine/threonine protein kinase
MESLRPDTAYGNYFKGRMERYRGSSTKAAGYWERALAIDPNHVNSLLWLLGAYAIQAGRPELADPLAKRLSQVDPLTPLSVFVVGVFHWMAGRFDEARSAIERCDALEPGWGLHPIVAYLLVWRNESEQALALLDQIFERNVSEILSQWAAFFKHALQGEKSEAMAALSEETKSFLWGDPEAQWLATGTYALLGEKEEAYRWLEHIIDSGWINYPVLSERDPLLENIRGEERFKELMVGVKREWEAFAKGRAAPV